MTEPEDVAPLLAAYRSIAGPDAAGSARTWSNLARRARAGEVVALAPEPIAAPRRPVAFVAAAAAAAVVVAALAYSVGAGSASETAPAAREEAVHGRIDDAVEGEIHETARVTPRAHTVAPAVLPATTSIPAEMMPTPVVEETVRPRPRRSKPAAIAPEAAPEASIDAAEIAALRDAQRLLARDPAAALAQLDRHATEYPRSSLAAMRQLAQMTALCQLGRVDDSRAAADAFIAANPSSPLVARVRDVCPAPSISQTEPHARGMDSSDGGR